MPPTLEVALDKLRTFASSLQHPYKLAAKVEKKAGALHIDRDAFGQMSQSEKLYKQWNALLGVREKEAKNVAATINYVVEAITYIANHYDETDNANADRTKRVPSYLERPRYR